MIKELNLEGNPPPGALYQVAGPLPGGWRILSVWESLEALDAFRRERVASHHWLKLIALCLYRKRAWCAVRQQAGLTFWCSCAIVYRL